jgi:hypothetical protein
MPPAIGGNRRSIRPRSRAGPGRADRGSRRFAPPGRTARRRGSGRDVLASSAAIKRTSPSYSSAMSRRRRSPTKRRPPGRAPRPRPGGDLAHHARPDS